MCLFDKMHKDLRTHVVPSNALTKQGIAEIRKYLQEQGLPAMPDSWVWDWKVSGKGTYVGSLPKRISKYVWIEHQVKLTSQQISQLGNIGASHCDRTGTYHVQFTKRFDWRAGDFGDEGSCYWGCRSAAREMLENVGAYAIKFFHDAEGQKGFARAWIVPHNGAAVLYNAYGIELVAVARIVSHIVGGVYRKIDNLENNGTDTGTLWINNGSGYIVGNAEFISTLPEDNYEIDLEIEELDNRETCCCCGCAVDEDEQRNNDNGDVYCESCYSDTYTWCEHCECECLIEDARTVRNRRGYEQYWCADCVSNDAFECNECGEYHHDDNCVEVEGDKYCQSCAESAYHCEECGEMFWHHSGRDHDGDFYCDDCFADKFTECEECQEVIEQSAAEEVNGKTMCSDCAEQAREEDKEEEPCLQLTV